MFNLDPAKLLIIVVVAVILLGPDKLPQVARQVGGAWRSFNEFRHRMETEVRGSIPDLPSTTDIARLGPLALGPAEPSLHHGREGRGHGGRGCGRGRPGRPRHRPPREQRPSPAPDP